MRPRSTSTVLLALLALGIAPAAAQALPPAFSAPRSFPATSGGDDSARAVALGDLDGDGRLDAAVALDGASAITILRGTGGGFGPATVVDVPGSPQRVEIADMDRDGRRDVVVATAGGVVVVRNTVEGWVPGEEVATPFSVIETGLAVADVTGDGNPDVVRSTTDFEGSVTVLAGDGAGGLNVAQTIPTDSFPEGLALADVNRDGLLDIVVGTHPAFSPATVDVVRNLGGGSFRRILGGPATSGYWPASVLAADLDGDGHPEIVLGDREFGGVSLLTGALFPEQFGNPWLGVDSAISTVAGDLDGDGNVDLLAVGGAQAGVLQGNGDGTFGEPLHPVRGLREARWAALGDLDADGAPDLVVVEPSGLLVYRNVRDVDPPVVTVSAPAPPTGQGGFFNAADSPVRVGVSADDPSGVAALRCTLDGADVPVDGESGASPRTGTVTVAGDGRHELTCEATDGVGNAGAFVGSSPSATLAIDSTPPNVSCDAAGAGTDTWHAAEQRVPCAAQDAGGSGLRSAADGGFELTTTVGAGREDAAAPTGSRTVCDVAGNCAAAVGPYAFAVDRQAPSVTCDAAPAFLLRQTGATVRAAVADAGSGPAASAVSGAADTGSAGARTVTLTGVDRVGNRATVACGYHVEYRFSGFANPLSDAPALNSIKAGQTATLKWSLADAANAPVTTLAASAVRVTVKAQDCAGNDLPGAAEAPAADVSALSTTAKTSYQVTWRTPASYAGTCQLVRLDLGEGPAGAPVTHDVVFRFKP